MVDSINLFVGLVPFLDFECIEMIPGLLEPVDDIYTIDPVTLGIFLRTGTYLELSVMYVKMTSDGSVIVGGKHEDEMVGWKLHLYSV